jgi:putative transposase
MVRQKREDFPGAWHHVMHRGARRAPIFLDREDNLAFLETLGEVVERSGLEVHAFSLMPNHYHLLLRSPQANLSEGMRYLNGTYTLWLNARHSWDGPVFRGRFRSQLVVDEAYLRYLLAYIHLNPVEAYLVKRLTDEAWTSHRAYLGKDTHHSWLTTGFFLEFFDGPEGVHEFVQSVRRGEVEYPPDFDIDTGLFKKKAIESDPAEPRPRRKRGGQAAPVIKGWHRLRSAETVLSEVLALTGVTEVDLRNSARGPGANPARRFAVWALNRSSMLNQREIAARLAVSFKQVVSLLARMRKQPPDEPVRSWIRDWLRREKELRGS